MAYAGENAVELVIAIGEEDMWGRGYGRLALSQAIGVAFFELRRERIIAHIYNENSRSRHSVRQPGLCTPDAGGKVHRVSAHIR